jgi:TolA-binding protein
MKEATIKALKQYFGDDIDFEKKVSEEDVAAAVSLIAKEYKGDFPEDLANAVGVIAKCATAGCDVKADNDDIEKAGAKFSKDVLQKLKTVLEAVESLKSILPDEDKSTKKSASSSELAKQVAQLTERVAKLTGEKDTSDKDDLAKALDGISKRLETIEKDGATKKSIEGEDDDNDDSNVQKGAGEKGEQLWPSITGQGK